jgi:FlaA1/EpsC-like NDP-sugar epimerase
VLDMGEPVRILDLARNMIRLSGKEPERDVAVAIVGVRPGEKLHEELWGEDETVSPTGHPKIMQVTRPCVDPAWLDNELGDLERLVEDGDTLELLSRLSAMVRDPARSASERPSPGRTHA